MVLPADKAQVEHIRKLSSYFPASYRAINLSNCPTKKNKKCLKLTCWQKSVLPVQAVCWYLVSLNWIPEQGMQSDPLRTSSLNFFSYPPLLIVILVLMVVKTLDF